MACVHAAALRRMNHALAAFVDDEESAHYAVLAK
jgi:hypothetical protein